MAGTYPAFHWLLNKCSNNYSGINPATKQVAVLHHAVEAIVLMVATPIFTYFIVKINFVQNIEEGDTMTVMKNMKTDFASTFLLCVCFMSMYLYELAARFENPRPAFVVHHLLAVLDGYLAMIFPTTVMVKTCCILVYFICFEALTFSGLFMYRVAPFNKYTPKVIFSGLVVFGFTRPIQVVWVGAAAFGSWGDPNHVKWQAILQFTLACVLTVLQVWTMKINYDVLKRCKSKIKRNEENNSNNTNTKRNISGSIESIESPNEVAEVCGDKEDFKSSIALLKAPTSA